MDIFKKRTGKEKNEAMWFYIVISPWLIGFFIFSLGPMIASIYFSLTRWNMLEDAEFIGFENYIRMFTDETLIKSIGNTLYYALLVVPISLVISLLLAYLLNKKLPGIRIFRTVYYLPVLVPLTAVAFVFQWVFNSEIGIVNQALLFVGIQGPNWLYDEGWQKLVVVFMGVWQVGSMMLLVLASMNGVAEEMYEAASIDGASKIRQFVQITIPLVSPVIFFNAIISIINCLQVFTEPYVITQGLFTPNNASLMINNYLYLKGFADSEMGYACAIGWLVFVIVIAANSIVSGMSRRFVYYEGEVDNGK